MPTLPNLPLLVTFTLLIFSSLTITKSDIPPCNDQDKAVLIKIRDHFGSQKGHFATWDNTTDCCVAWDYLGCDTSPSVLYGRITALIFFPSGDLSGTIPSEIADLPYVSYLVLADNENVTRTIPKSISKLKKPYHLDLGRNRLTGTIPNEIFKLKKLKELDLSSNQLSGPIPPAASSLPLLAQFNVSNNKLTGSIPSLSNSLKSIDVISYNQLCGQIPSGLKRFRRTNFEHNKCLCSTPLAAGSIHLHDKQNLFI